MSKTIRMAALGILALGLSASLAHEAAQAREASIASHGTVPIGAVLPRTVTAAADAWVDCVTVQHIMPGRGTDEDMQACDAGFWVATDITANTAGLAMDCPDGPVRPGVCVWTMDRARVAAMVA